MGPWAKDKLARLAKYLAAYTTILRKQKFKGYVYLDAFAGAGRARIRSKDATPATGDLFEREEPEAEQREVFDGSPRVALTLPHPFTHYVFLETDPKRVKMLNELQREFPQHRITVRETDCNDYLMNHFLTAVNWREWRSVAFLDPFGMQLPWSTLEALGNTRAIEVFINFPVGMAINRLLKRSGQFSSKERKKLDTYFGSGEWFDLLYETLEDLFGEKRIQKRDGAANRLVSWYRGRLKSAFGEVSAPYLVKNTRGNPLYYLIFAGPNKTGRRIATDILASGEPVRSGVK